MHHNTSRRFVFLVSQGKKMLFRHALAEGDLLIGRESPCDLILDNKEVSRRHASVRIAGGAVAITDRGSRNGTSVNGRKISQETALVVNDEVGIDCYNLRLVEAGERADGGDDPLPGETEGPDEAGAPMTRALSESEYLDPGKRREKEKADARRKAAQEITDGMRYDLICSEGQHKGEIFPLTAAGLRIGRQMDMDISLDNDAVSQFHATVFLSGRQMMIRDEGSLNGVFINGRRAREAELSHGDRLRIGLNTFKVQAEDVGAKRRVLLIGALLSFLVAMVAGIYLKIQPAPKEQESLNNAHEAFQEGHFEEALRSFERALKLAPGNREAIEGQQAARKKIEMRKKLQDAQDAALREDYVVARDLCAAVLAEDGHVQEAKNLAEVLNNVDDANRALAAKNWADAVVLYEKAATKYKKSALIEKNVARARLEARSHGLLQKGKIALDEGNPMEAVEILGQVDSASLAHAEAQEVIQKSQKILENRNRIDQARALFRTGDLSGARTHLSAALQASPDDPEVQRLSRLFQNLEPVLRKLDAAPTALSSGSIEDLVALQRDSASVVAAIQDPLSELQKRAQAVQEGAAQKISEINRTNHDLGRKAYESGNSRDAIMYLGRAVKGDPDNQDAKQKLEQARQMVDDRCRKLYEDAKMHQRLGFPKEARKMLQDILGIAVPGEMYYDRAVETLKTLPEG